MTEFCGIPLTSLRENSITELDLTGKGVGVPGATVLSKLLPSAAALTSLKCACGPRAFAFLSAPIDTLIILITSRSLGNNNIGVNGCKAIAAVLKDTQITALRCACATHRSLIPSVNAH